MYCEEGKGIQELTSVCTKAYKREQDKSNETANA